MTKTVRRLDNWKVWVGIAYFGLVITVVWLYYLNQRQSDTQAKQARDEAVRIAEVESTTQAQRDQCRASIPTLARINGFVDGVYDLHAVLEKNARLIAAATPKADPAYTIRQENWKRIRATVTKVAGVHFPVPTRAECEAIGKPRTKGTRP